MAYGVTAAVDYDWGYPATVNHADQAAFAAEVAAEISGADAVDGDSAARNGVRGFQLYARGAAGGLFVHGHRPGGRAASPGYDFNDEAAPIGASFFARLVERAQPVG